MKDYIRRSAVAETRDNSRAKMMHLNSPQQTPRREFGELNNLNKPLYTSGQFLPQPSMFPQPTAWTNRSSEASMVQNAYYRQTQSFEPTYSYNSFQSVPQHAVSASDIRKSQAVRPTSPNNTSIRQRNPTASSYMSSPKKEERLPIQPPSSPLSNQKKPPVPQANSTRPTSTIRGSLVSPVKPRQPEMPPPPEQFVSPYRFQYSYRSKKGYIPNVIKQNQDICVVSANISNRPWEHFFAVCDGHGPAGHHVTAFIHNHFMGLFSKHQEFYKKPQENLYLAFKQAVESLTKESFDVSTSGSTVVSCYIHQEKLFCSNVGDSRAVIGSKDPVTGKWAARQLSNDHKPSLASEAQRIIRCNGRVEAMKDQRGYPMGPLRVWLQSSAIPGLAMTRSIGDLVASQIGVTWEPEVTEHVITRNDKMLILASDGVWEFLSNEEVVAKLAPFYEARKLQEASSFLMDHSVASWNYNMPMVDDISFVLLFFTHDQ